MQMKDRFDLTSARQGLSDLNLSALGYSPLAPLPFFSLSSLPGLGALGIWPSRLSPGSGTGSYSGGGGNGRNGGGSGGGPVPPQVKPLMEMEPPPLNTRIPASAWLPPPQ